VPRGDLKPDLAERRAGEVPGIPKMDAGQELKGWPALEASHRGVTPSWPPPEWGFSLQQSMVEKKEEPGRTRLLECLFLNILPESREWKN
jgi:hypothetical protein